MCSDKSNTGDSQFGHQFGDRGTEEIAKTTHTHTHTVFLLFSQKGIFFFISLWTVPCLRFRFRPGSHRPVCTLFLCPFLFDILKSNPFLPWCFFKIGGIDLIILYCWRCNKSQINDGSNVNNRNDITVVCSPQELEHWLPKCDKITPSRVQSTELVCLCHTYQQRFQVWGDFIILQGCKAALWL